VLITKYFDNVGSLTGDFDSGTGTDDTTPLLKGTVIGLRASDVIKIFEEGSSTALGNAIVVGGAWEFQLGNLTELTPGQHTYVAKIFSLAGVEGSHSNDFSFRVDIVPPEPPVLTIDTYTDDQAPQVGTFDFSVPTNDTTPVINGTIGGTLWSADRVQVLRDGVVVGLATVSGSSWTFQDSGLVDGQSYVYTVRVLDGAGSAGRTAVPQTLTVDTTVPVEYATIITITDDVWPQMGVVANDGYTNDTTPTLSGVVSAALQPDETLHVLRDGVDVGLASMTGTSWTYTDSGLADGQAYTYTVRVVDDAGNAGSLSNSYRIHVDTKAPTETVTITAVIDNVSPVTGTVPNGGTTHDLQPELQGSISSALEPSEQVYVFRWGVEVGIATVNGTSWSYTDNGLGVSGIDTSYSYTAQVRDDAGNTGQMSGAYEITIVGGLLPPPPTIMSVTDDVLPVTGVVPSGGYTNDATPTLDGTLTFPLSGAEQVHVFRDGVDVGIATVTRTNWTFTDSGLTDGLHTYWAMIDDGAGNFGLASNNYSINVDTGVPTQSVQITQAIDNVDPVTRPISPGGVTNDDTPEIQGTLSAVLTGTEQVHVFRNGVDVGVATTSGTNWTFTDGGLASGAYTYYTYTAEVVDAAGNASQPSNSLSFMLTPPGTPSTQPTIVTITDDVLPVTGVVPSMGYTNDTAPTLNGVLAVPLAGTEQLHVFRNGLDLGLATVNGTNWTFQDSGLADGQSYSYLVQTINAEGTLGAPSNAYRIFIDTTAPAQTVTITTIIDNVLPASNGGATHDHLPEIQGTLSSVLTGTEQVHVFRDGVDVGIATTSGTSWMYTDSSGLTIGSN
jgi:hypothetical protein